MLVQLKITVSLAAIIVSSAFLSPCPVPISQQRTISKQKISLKSGNLALSSSASVDASGVFGLPSNVSASLSRDDDVYDIKFDRRAVTLGKLGKLNLYGLYYGSISIALGCVWFVALKALWVFYKMTGGAIDKRRRMVIFCNHVWGVCLLRLTGCYPRISNLEKLDEIHKTSTAAMFVANHCSWMDIPYVGAAIGYGHVGWRNYKFVSKKELEKVPILGGGLIMGQHVVIDRTNRRSQINTLKSGIATLRDGVHLITFPEGTRSRTGRLLPLKRGAFKMAQSADAKIVPISISGAELVMPAGWLMPMQPSRNIVKVTVGDPIDCSELDEKELGEKVKNSLERYLPPKQLMKAS